MIEHATLPVVIGGWFSFPYFLYSRIPELTDSELRLILCIGRHTLGWHRWEVALAHPIITREVGLHQTSIRRAIVLLEAKGILAVTQRSLGGRELNVFRLLLPEETRRTLPAAPPKTKTPCSLHGDPMQTACHAKKVPSNEGKKEQQQRSAVQQLRTEPDVSSVSADPTPHPAAASSKNDLTEEQKKLLERMRAVGVGRTVALRLLAERPAEVVRLALDHLPRRNARRPAAVLVRELQEGGWETPREVVAEQKHQAAEDARRALEAERANREQQEAQAVEDRFRATWEALSEARRAEAVAEARKRVPWAAHLPGALEADSPLLRGAVREVVAEWEESAVLGDAQILESAEVTEEDIVEGSLVSGQLEVTPPAARSRHGRRRRAAWGRSRESVEAGPGAGEGSFEPGAPACEGGGRAERRRQHQDVESSRSHDATTPKRLRAPAA